MVEVGAVRYFFPQAFLGNTCWIRLSAELALQPLRILIFPLPEKTAIRLQPPEEEAMERTREPVRSTPTSLVPSLPFSTPITLYTCPLLSVTVNGMPADLPSV